MNDEIWKDIPDFPDYEITNNGKVRSKDRVIVSSDGKKQKRKSRIINPFLDSYGYQYVDLRKNKKRVRMKVHRLVAMTFVENPNPEKYNIVNHIDGNKLNCNYKNLEWTYNKGNSIHATKNGLNKIDNILKHSAESRIKIGKYDIDMNLICIYESLMDALRDLNINENNNQYLKKMAKEGKIYKGFYWKLLDK